MLRRMAEIHGGQPEPVSTLRQAHVAPAPALPAEQDAQLCAQLERDVRALAVELGERNLRDAPRFFHLERAATLLEQRLQQDGLRFSRQAFRAGNLGVRNLEVELTGTQHPDEVLVVGARYDSARGSAGVNDNATGVAALLALARRCAALRPARTVRFVAFATGPHTPAPGSRVYAERCAARGEQLVGMLSLEALGRSARKGAPAVMAVANLGSRRLARTVAWAFNHASPAPRLRCQTAFVPGLLPGVSASDPGAFWQQQAPAVRVTETFPLSAWRDDERVEQLDFARLAHVVQGLERVLERLSGAAH